MSQLFVTLCNEFFVHDLVWTFKRPKEGTLSLQIYSKPCLKGPLKTRPKLVFKTDYRLMQVKRTALLLTCITLPSVIKIFFYF